MAAMFMAGLLQITLKNYKVHEHHNSPQDPPPVSRPGQAAQTEGDRRHTYLKLLTLIGIITIIIKL